MIQRLAVTTHNVEKLTFFFDTQRFDKTREYNIFFPSRVCDERSLVLVVHPSIIGRSFFLSLVLVEYFSTF